MKAPAPGHVAVSIVLDLVEMVRDRMSFRLFVENHKQLRELLTRAEAVAAQSTRGVKPYDLTPKGDSKDLIGFCEMCGTYHTSEVEVHP